LFDPRLLELFNDPVKLEIIQSLIKKYPNEYSIVENFKFIIDRFATVILNSFRSKGSRPIETIFPKPKLTKDGRAIINEFKDSDGTVIKVVPNKLV